MRDVETVPAFVLGEITTSGIGVVAESVWARGFARSFGMIQVNARLMVGVAGMTRSSDWQSAAGIALW